MPTYQENQAEHRRRYRLLPWRVRLRDWWIDIKWRWFMRLPPYRVQPTCAKCGEHILPARHRPELCRACYRKSKDYG